MEAEQDRGEHMNVNSLMFWVAAIACIAVFWRLVARRQLREEPQHRNPWHCVSIQCGTSPCSSARHLQGRRFLSDDAPPLPLPYCDGRTCACRFRHFSDRRVGDRRALPSFAAAVWATSGKNEQRVHRERRKY
jgi:hypothetical protein